MKRYVKKFKEDDELDLIKQVESTVDLSPLEAEVKRLLGKDIKFKISMSSGRYLHLRVESQDLTAFTGILKKFYATSKIETFNSSVKKESNGDVVWMMTLDFAFSYRNGGSNGVSLLSAWYNLNTKKWKFRPSV